MRRSSFDEYERDGYRVQRYRPRIEGLFARIERWTCLDTREEHWRSISRDNIVTVYGLDEDSRIANPEDPTQVFSWLICRSFDDRGNVILYEYAAENDRGVDVSKPNECHRIRTANRYPKRILYGNRRPLFLDPANASFRSSHLEPIDSDAAQWMFEVVFDYGEGHYQEEERDADGRIISSASAEAGPDWPLRRDPFSSYRSGFEIRTYRLCRRVLMFHRFPDELGSASALVRSTAFEYKRKNDWIFPRACTAVRPSPPQRRILPDAIDASSRLFLFLKPTRRTRQREISCRRSRSEKPREPALRHR